MQNQQQIWEVTSTWLSFAIVKVLLWRWKAFLGRSSTACFNFNCICLLIHRANCWSASRSQPTTSRTPEAGSCLSPDVGRNIGTSVALRSVSAGLCVKCKVYFLWRNKPSLHICRTWHLKKWRGFKTDHSAPASYSLLQTFLVGLWLFRKIYSDVF